MMSAWLRRKEYLSPDIINEIIVMMGQAVLRKILTQIKGAMWSAVIADETTDISHKEQMCVSIRWINSSYEIHEEPLGLVQLPAETLISVITDILVRCSLPITLCRGLAYDGASNMSGIRSGVQALVKCQENRALYVHYTVYICVCMKFLNRLTLCGMSL